VSEGDARQATIDPAPNGAVPPKQTLISIPPTELRHLSGIDLGDISRAHQGVLFLDDMREFYGIM
jgi:hypothetical protein